MESKDTQNDLCNDKVILNKPYPPINVIQPNPTYGKLLLINYAGAISELTSAMQYEYGHLRLSTAYPKISNILKCISEVEFRHLDILGELITKLGEDPKYAISRRGRTLYWNASFVNYDQTVDAILRQNISDERMQIGEYNKTLNQINDYDIQAILERIIDDEEQHIKVLNEIISVTPDIY